MDEMMTKAEETVALTPGALREGIHTQYLLALEQADRYLVDAIAWGEIHPQLDGAYTNELSGSLDVIGKARQAVTADPVPQFETIQ